MLGGIGFKFSMILRPTKTQRKENERWQLARLVTGKVLPSVPSAKALVESAEEPSLPPISAITAMALVL